MRLHRLFLIAATFVVLLSSCNDHKVYDQYNHTPIAGWEKNDTLLFDIPPLTRDGQFGTELGLRINGAYPFMSLALIVEQTIYPEKRIQIDTINCKLIDKNGIPKGQGVNYYQYNFPITQLQLKQGDSIHVTIRHDMQREILPGISDIGFMLSAD
ncbi:MAG TPA: gliding motility lipoprotein GldH [Prevotella sp.]